MITKLEMSSITYLHTAQKETIPVNFVRMWRQFHGCPASGGGIEQVFFSAGKQHDTLTKKTRDKTLESTLKAQIAAL
jgi:hypothetical protein